MDGLSGALAIISFSIQLIGTIRKAQIFLKEVRNAPEELENLVDTLAQLEDLLVATNNLVEQQKSIENLPGAVDNIASALRRCQTTIRKLDEAVLTINRYFETQNRGRKVWASLKTVVKKDHIEKLRKQTQENTINLQTALTLNFSYLQIHQLKLLSMQQFSLPTATNLCVRPKCSVPGTISHDRTYTVQTKETVNWLYCGLFGTVKLRKKTKVIGTHRNTPEKAIIEEKRLLYTPSFLRMALELRYDTGFFQVPKSLSFVQVLPTDFMLGMCYRGNVEPFTQALSQGRFSPFARSHCGGTWLHMAAIFSNPDLCSLLVKIGVDPTQTDDYGAKALHQVYNRSSSQADTMRVLTTGQDVSAEDLSFLWNDAFSGSPECVDLLLSTYSHSDEIFHASVQDFSLLGIAVREYGSGNVDWGSSIRKWLRRKPDVHTRSLRSEIKLGQGLSLSGLFHRSELLCQHQEMTFTLLDELFAFNSDPFQAELLAQEWLLMLAEANYDINTYLTNEKRLHCTQNFLSYPDCSSYGPNMHRQLVFEIGENPKVSWDWWIDPLSHASLALHEFRYMNPCDKDGFFQLHYSDETWPFEYPHWSAWGSAQKERKEWKEWKERADQAARRHNRQAKKKYPGYFEHILKDVVIPGAWVEDK